MGGLSMTEFEKRSKGPVYLHCPNCGKKRVTKRDFSDGNGYACDRCEFSVYIEEEGDQPDIQRLADENATADIQFMYRPEDDL